MGSGGTKVMQHPNTRILLAGLREQASYPSDDEFSSEGVNDEVTNGQENFDKCSLFG